jgi:hypothetical protein
MTTAERNFARPRSPRLVATDGRAWLLALAGLAALALSGVIAAQDAPPDRNRSATVSTGESDHSRWASPGPRWRSRSQILQDAGILHQR